MTMDETPSNTMLKVENPALPTALDERELLKQRARMLGIEFSNNIGTDTLKERINEKIAGTKPAEAELNPLGETPGVRVKSLRETIQEEQMRLIRLRITNMDPKKKDLPGEIFTIANEYLGTVRKFVPFGEQTEGGFHVPFCIYTMMDERKFLNIRVTKDRRTGQSRVENNWAKEFALEVLPPLTQAELDNLKTAQIAAGSLD